MNNFKTVMAMVFGMALMVAPYADADTAFARDSNDVIYRSTQKTLKQARAEVIKYCKKNSIAGKCKQLDESKADTSGYGAAAASKTRVGTATGYRTQDAASDAALQMCAQETAIEDTCRVTMSFYDDTHDVSTPDGKWEPKKPVGKDFRYTDSCFNGDCVRTFEDGKKSRFQAPYCYDQNQGRWDWKPSGC